MLGYHFLTLWERTWHRVRKQTEPEPKTWLLPGSMESDHRIHTCRKNSSLLRIFTKMWRAVSTYLVGEVVKVLLAERTKDSTER